MGVRVSWFVVVLSAVVCVVHGQRGFSCANWDSYTKAQFASFATYPNIIGENGRKCTITRGGPNTACRHYVKYDIDLNSSNDWVGLSWGGVAGVGGTGCCSSVADCFTLLDAAGWLKTQHKQYCCGQEPVFSCRNWDSYTQAQFASFATYPNIIGENGRKCTITRGGPNTACRHYVKYDIDRNSFNNWLGLTWGGQPGGSGCCGSVPGCNTVSEAARWLKNQYKSYCCGR